MERGGSDRFGWVVIRARAGSIIILLLSTYTSKLYETEAQLRRLSSLRMALPDSPTTPRRARIRRAASLPPLPALFAHAAELYTISPEISPPSSPTPVARKTQDVPQELVEGFRHGGSQKREAVGKLLDLIYDGLKTVTIRAPDYDTLMVLGRSDFVDSCSRY